jgi:peptidoglycan/LPS O-acetylase OafA/YrhL
VTHNDVRRAPDVTDGFRPDLEGLRAVAVVLVLLYHASVPGMTGGYVGVDVFFVLSGFLITGLMLREARRTGTISLPAFYARRARRLLPASALVLLVTVVASALFLPPLRVPDVAGDAASAALYVSNIHFALQATDYLQAELAPSPILHFWSLSVEEQFYLFWPAILLVVIRLSRNRGDIGRWVAPVAGGIVVVSFAVSLWLTQVNGPWAFFSLITRAWELGLGALLAVGAVRLARLPDRPAAIAAWVGLAMIGLSAIVLDTSTPYPGTAALLPTVGSALVIAGGFRQSALAPGRWLSLRIPGFLGRISYSLYLWHWPILVIPAAALDTKLPWWMRGALVALAIACAAATQRWVETPFRKGRWVGMLPRRNLAMAGALTLIVATVSLGIGVGTTNALRSDVATNSADAEARLDQILGNVAAPSPRASTSPAPGGSASLTPGGSEAPDPSAAASPAVAVLPRTVGGPLPADLRPSIGEARDDHPLPYTDGCHAVDGVVANGSCVYGDPNGARTIVLMGDSHALQWFPAVNRLAIERGWRFLNLTKGSCASAQIGEWNGRLQQVFTDCTEWRAKTLARIEAEHPAIVLVANSRAVQFVDDAGKLLTGAARDTAWRHGMDVTLTRLTRAADHVVVIGDTPRSTVDVPVCLSSHENDTLACATPVANAISSGWLEAERAAATRNKAGFVDPSRWVCPSEPCPAVIGSYLVYIDAHHLTTPFSSALWERLGLALQEQTGLS